MDRHRLKIMLFAMVVMTAPVALADLIVGPTALPVTLHRIGIDVVFEVAGTVGVAATLLWKLVRWRGEWKNIEDLTSEEKKVLDTRIECVLPKVRSLLENAYPAEVSALRASCDNTKSHAGATTVIRLADDTFLTPGDTETEREIDKLVISLLVKEEKLSVECKGIPIEMLCERLVQELTGTAYTIKRYEDSHFRSGFSWRKTVEARFQKLRELRWLSVAIAVIAMFLCLTWWLRR